VLVLLLAAVNARCSEQKRSPAETVNASSVGVSATPAGAQFARWLKAFNSGNREALLAYHAQHFAYSAASADVSNIDRERALSLASNGFDEKQVEDSAPFALTIVLEERARPQFARVRLEVEPVAPHRVLRFEIGPIPTPRQFASQDELAQRRVDAARRQTVVASLSRELEGHYVLADVAQKMSVALAQQLARGGYDNISDAADLAEALTRDLRQVSHDKHLRVHFGFPPPPPPLAATDAAPPPWMVEQNFGFGEVQRLPGDAALLVINGFVPLGGAVVEEAIGARMAEVADADAVIVDLRSNHGGAPDTVALIASYFFEAKAMLLNTIQRRDTGQTWESWTKPKLAGRRFGSTKPVYVLTSEHTFSGGEDLAYTLQAHKRALVVGEVTGGGAHPTEPRAIDESLYVDMPWGRTVNPITNSNWEGTGVQPDIVTASDQALARALQHLRSRK
jgi:retinol-binding protein 3